MTDAPVRCRQCRRPLTNPQHSAAGIGPKCAEKLGLTFVKPEKIRRARVASHRVRKVQEVEAPMLPFEELEEA